MIERIDNLQSQVSQSVTGTKSEETELKDLATLLGKFLSKKVTKEKLETLKNDLISSRQSIESIYNNPKTSDSVKSEADVLLKFTQAPNEENFDAILNNQIVLQNLSNELKRQGVTADDAKIAEWENSNQIHRFPSIVALSSSLGTLENGDSIRDPKQFTELAKVTLDSIAILQTQNLSQADFDQAIKEKVMPTFLRHVDQKTIDSLKDPQLQEVANYLMQIANGEQTLTGDHSSSMDPLFSTIDSQLFGQTATVSWEHLKSANVIDPSEDFPIDLILQESNATKAATVSPESKGNSIRDPKQFMELAKVTLDSIAILFSQNLSPADVNKAIKEKVMPTFLRHVDQNTINSLNDSNLKAVANNLMQIATGAQTVNNLKAIEPFFNTIDSQLFGQTATNCWQNLKSANVIDASESFPIDLVQPALRPTVTPTSMSTLPSIKNGAALFTYENNSGLSDDRVFITIKGVQNGAQCMVKYDANGVPTYVPASSHADPTQYSYPLSFFPKSIDGQPTFYLPEFNGGGARLYTSLQQPLKFTFAGDMVLEPDPGNSSDPNKNIIYDKIEFSVKSTDVFLNNTSVDWFSLPLGSQLTLTNGKTLESTRTDSRDAIFHAMQNELNAAGGPWPNLIKTTGANVSRIVSQANGLPANYFTTSQNGSSWMSDFTNAFSQTPIQINESGTLWKGTINPTTNVITFVNAGGPGPKTIQITLPKDANDLLRNVAEAWGGLPTSLHYNIAATLQAGIVSNTLTAKEPMDRGYFQRNQNRFYTTNEEPGMPQFIDHYSKVLHNFGKGYTFAYDDHLDYAGEISANPLPTFKQGKVVLGPIHG